MWSLKIIPKLSKPGLGFACGFLLLLFCCCYYCFLFCFDLGFFGLWKNSFRFWSSQCHCIANWWFSSMPSGLGKHIQSSIQDENIASPIFTDFYVTKKSLLDRNKAIAQVSTIIIIRHHHFYLFDLWWSVRDMRWRSLLFMSSV